MLEIYTVSFFGHRYIERFSFAERCVQRIVNDLIRQKEYVDFLVGRDGDFDQIAASAVRRAKQEVFDGNSYLTWVLPYEKAEYRDNQKNFDQYYDAVEICEASDGIYPKAAIQARNRNMIDRSDLAIFYVERESGGAFQTMQYAKSVDKAIINIADITEWQSVHID